MPVHRVANAIVFCTYKWRRTSTISWEPDRLSVATCTGDQAQSGNRNCKSAREGDATRRDGYFVNYVSTSRESITMRTDPIPSRKYFG